MKPRRGVLTTVAVLAVVFGLGGRAAIYRSLASLPAPVTDLGEPFVEEPERLALLTSAGRRIEPLHQRMGKPNPGDWLDRHPEPGQTFEEYRAGSPSRPTAQLTTLYIQKWGDFDDTQSAVVDRVAELLGRFYGVPVKFEEPVSLDSVDDQACPPHPERGDRRLLSTYVLEELRGSHWPNDAAGRLAMTTVDLTRTGGGTWAFGQASLCDRVAVCSLFRQGDPHEDFTLCVKRTLKTSVHEVGHMFGLTHCAAFECAMNGSNHREEADARPLWFCPEDEMKVWLACRLDPARRYASLAAWARSNGLDAEARFWARSRQAIADPSDRAKRK
ncbi:archaemetzincin [Singulisphaera sp. GP187]|uniref:archaemetzincin n=1 Tax=Singulisphaera sp. GP187 TaxID=1882752 RepID=UPI0009270E43|nr:archaemetzincin [Singulisphaera sp. GP187]SIO60318.1 archaemetzincin [Singulisphaera sp. GP187]